MICKPKSLYLQYLKAAGPAHSNSDVVRARFFRFKYKLLAEN